MVLKNTTLRTILDVLVPFGPYLRRSTTAKPFSYVWDLILRVIPQTFFIYWLFSFIPYVGTLLYILLLVPLSARMHIDACGSKDSSENINIYLWYFTVIAIGFGGVWSFVGHTLLADSVAMQIGWATGSPFQTELAFYTLGSGIAGLLAIWVRGHMITATVITKATFWYGAGYVHIQDAILNQNYSYLNIGPPLLGDIILPTILLLLLFKILRTYVSSDPNFSLRI